MKKFTPSVHVLPSGSKLVGDANPDQTVTVTVYVKSEEALQTVEVFAAKNNLVIADANVEALSIKLTGPLSVLADAFHVEVKNYEHPKGHFFRHYDGAISLPVDLHDKVIGVLGLGTTTKMVPHHKVRAVEHAASMSYYPDQVASMYNFPNSKNGLDGTGQCVAIIELGGGYDAAQLASYFKSRGVGPVEVVSVGVDGGKNVPDGDPNGADGEVMLDVQVIGCIAPKAKLVVYFATNTDQGFVDAITTAMTDKVNKPSVISISWGAPEDQWSAQSMMVMSKAIEKAATLGVTTFVASGDGGSSDGESGLHVDFPASAPCSIACGGTYITTNGGKITSESVWGGVKNDGAGGGGYSSVYNVTAYQKGVVTGKKRGVPDVSANADPRSGYNINVDGQLMVIGGTSAVSPLFSALAVLVNQHRGKPLGYFNQMLYTAHKAACNDVVTGTNGSYKATIGWDAASGLGSIDGTKLLAALPK